MLTVYPIKYTHLSEDDESQEVTAYGEKESQKVTVDDGNERQKVMRQGESECDSCPDGDE